MLLRTLSGTIEVDYDARDAEGYVTRRGTPCYWKQIGEVVRSVHNEWNCETATTHRKCEKGVDDTAPSRIPSQQQKMGISCLRERTIHVSRKIQSREVTTLRLQVIRQTWPYTDGAYQGFKDE